METNILTEFPTVAAVNDVQKGWDHMSVTVREGADLNTYAGGCWELVSVVRASRADYVVAYFKRRRQ